MSSTGWSCVALVERQPADHAQAGAVGTVERGDRLGQRDGVDDRRPEVELVMVGQAQRVGLVVRRDRSPGRQVDRGQVLLLEIDVDGRR